MLGARTSRAEGEGETMTRIKAAAAMALATACLLAGYSAESEHLR
jgi:hypothetical protein